MVHVLVSLVMMITVVVQTIVCSTSTLTAQKGRIDHKMEIVSRLQSGRATALHRCAVIHDRAYDHNQSSDIFWSS